MSEILLLQCKERNEEKSARVSGLPWSVPRLRGRGEQGQKCEADPLVSRAL
jgi:hypothetical protein